VTRRGHIVTDGRLREITQGDVGIRMAPESRARASRQQDFSTSVSSNVRVGNDNRDIIITLLPGSIYSIDCWDFVT